jgi:vancomycin resistance protein VanW
MLPPPVIKPVNRSPLRKIWGKEYFILKRKIKWIAGPQKFASKLDLQPLDYSLIKHQSFLLRPLKDVDMVLQHNKVKNLSIALEKLNGIIIQPGETFSIWKRVGKPTQKKGYLNGLVLDNGRIAQGIGGGLCQLGNLLYWMALHTPLAITERWRHSYDVFPDINRTIPFACGATLSYNYVDLQLANHTDAAFQIHLWLDEAYLQGEIRSNIKPVYTYSIIESDHLISQQWWGGYTRHNKIWQKRMHQKTLEVQEELVSENHAIMMYNPLLGE